MEFLPSKRCAFPFHDYIQLIADGGWIEGQWLFVSCRTIGGVLAGFDDCKQDPFGFLALIGTGGPSKKQCEGLSALLEVLTGGCLPQNTPPTVE